MKAITYGPAHVLELAEIERSPLADDEVLLQVRAASVNPLDAHMLQTAPWLRGAMFKMLGVRVNRPGADVAGVVEAVGKKVTAFKPGDEVFGGSGGGGFAEYASPPASRLAKKPANVSFAEAACLNVAGRTALQGLRDVAAVAPGHRVLINGASGGVGTFAVQIAKWLGADVTAVCSTRNLDLVRELGATYVIDYTREDLLITGERYDAIFDLVGDRRLLDLKRALTPKGVYVGGGVLGLQASMAKMLAGMLGSSILSLLSSQRMVSFMAKSDRGDLPELAELMETRTIKAVIDRTFDLDQVPEAVRYVAAKHARGKVVITIGEPD